MRIIPLGGLEEVGKNIMAIEYGKDIIVIDCGMSFAVPEMLGVDYIISKAYIDTTRMAAMGGSFGGYMTNWIATRTDRFTCLVSHASVFNLESKYGTTDELFFPEWEFGGPPWENRENYRRFSPHNFAHQMKTPTLVIVGELDYRSNGVLL